MAHQGLGSCCMFTHEICVFLWPYHALYKGKRLRCFAFDKFHTKEMCLLTV